MELVVIAFRNVIRIWIGDSHFMHDYVPCDKPAVAVEILDHPTVINVVAADETVLYSRMLDQSFQSFLDYAPVLDDLLVWTSALEQEASYRVKTLLEEGRIRLTLEPTSTNHPTLH